ATKGISQGCTSCATAGWAAVGGVQVQISHSITADVNSATQIAAGRQAGASDRRSHSHRAAPAATSRRMINGHALGAMSAPSSTSSRTTAVTTRCINIKPLPVTFSGAVGQLLAGAPEAAFPRTIPLESLIEIAGPEVGPVALGEVEFCVGQLPDQEVGNALLAPGTDEEIRFRGIGH